MYFCKFKLAGSTHVAAPCIRCRGMTPIRRAENGREPFLFNGRMGHALYRKHTNLPLRWHNLKVVQ